MQPIRLTRLTAQNAMSFRKIDVQLEGQGLVLVRGRNGSAKSAIFESLRHILLGTTARGIKGKEFVRAGSEKGYLGTLWLERDDSKFVVKQSVAHHKLGNQVSIWRNDVRITHKRAKLRNQKRVAYEILGMSPEQFDSWVYISQEAAHPLVGGSGAECSTYLSESFGLYCYDEMHEKLKLATKQVDQHVGEVRAYEDVLAEQQRMLAANPPLEELQGQLNALDVQLTMVNADLERAQRDLLSARQAKQDQETRKRLRAKLGEYEGSSTKELSALITATTAKLKQTNQRIMQASAAAERQAQRDRLVRQIDDVKAVIAQQDQRVKSIKQHDAEASKLIRTARAEIDELAGDAAQLAKLRGLDGKGECPTCGNELDAKHLAKELRRAEAASTKMSEIKQRVAALERAMADNARVVEEHARKTTRLMNLENQLGDLGEIDQDPIDLDALQAQRDRRQEILTSATRAFEAMEELDAIRGTTPKINIDLDVAEAVFLAARQASNELVGEIGTIRSRISETERLQRALQGTQQKIDQLARFKRENDLRKKLQKALRRLKVRRIHSIVEALTKTLPTYVEQMFDEDVVVEVDDENPDSIERWISKPHPTRTDERIRIPVRALSKGERAKLRVAFIWAIRRLMRPERTTNILVLDEADGGLDQQGLEAYGALLEQLRSEYESVFVISHRTELNTVKFDHVWNVVKRDGVSHIEES